MPNLDGHNLHLNLEHTALSLIPGDPVPLTIELGLTDRCNHRCIYCAFDYKRPGKRTDTDTKTLVDWILEIPRPLGATARAYGGPLPQSFHLAGDGEPTLHPCFEHIVKTLHHRGFKIGVTTNGSAPQKLLRVAKYLVWLRFSVDAGTQEVYQRIHGSNVDLDETFNTIYGCVLAAPKTVVGVQSLILDQQRDDLQALITRCKNAELDYLAFKPYSQHPQSKSTVATTARTFIRSLVDDNYEGPVTPKLVVRVEPSLKDYVGCFAAASLFWVAGADGGFYPCAQYMGDCNWCFGDLNLQSYADIRRSPRRRSIIKKLRKLDTSTCRHPCRCDRANRYLNRFNDRKDSDAFL